MSDNQFTPIPDEQQTAGDQNGVAASAMPPRNDNQGIATGVAQIAIAQADIERLGIPLDWVKKDPALIRLILDTESMKDEERKYWFQLLPIMTEEQMVKLRGILDKEKQQLAALDAKYAAEVAQLNEQHLAQLQMEKMREKRKANEKAEAVAEAAETKEEDELMRKIEEM